MAESPERKELEFKLKAISYLSPIAIKQVADQIEALNRPAPEHGWSAEMAKALSCGHTQAQHDYAQTGTLKLEPCEFSRPAPDAAMVERPRIICLCGSTRFIEQFAVQTWELERMGNIVLGCTLLPMWYCQVADHFGEKTGTKDQCDELHLRKIDLADEILVLNFGGYIGESTKREILYAKKHGKPVKYVEKLMGIGEEEK